MDQLRANIDVYQIDEEKTPFYENKDKSSMSAHWCGIRKSGDCYGEHEYTRSLSRYKMLIGNPRHIWEHYRFTMSGDRRDLRTSPDSPPTQAQLEVSRPSTLADERDRIVGTVHPARTVIRLATK